MKRAYAKPARVHKRPPSGSSGSAATAPTFSPNQHIQLPLDRQELLGMMPDSLEGPALELGLLVASSLLEDEVTRLCGPRYQRLPNRSHTRYGHQRGVATLAGQKIAIDRPRVRHTDGRGEAALEMYARLQSPQAMPVPCCGGWSAA